MPSKKNQSILDLASLEKAQIDFLFSLSNRFADFSSEKMELNGLGKTGALLFFEASTRTRLSFETASVRLGIHPLLLDGRSGSSLEKGESIEDTVLNIDAMGPSYLVIRCGDNVDLHSLSNQVRAPILNAGWGRRGHPSQALLDAYTIYRNFGTCSGQRLLIVGDVRHSRVAASHFELAPKLGYEVALCGPPDFLPEAPACKVFLTLKEGLEWASVVMALRVQAERHERQHKLASYRDTYGLNVENLKSLSESALVMHPGPINQGVELDPEVLCDPRSQVLNQVRNGVLIRQGLIYLTMIGG